MGKDHGTITLVLGHATKAMAKHYSRRRVTSVVSDLEAELNKPKLANSPI
jgi:hypothetical protein